MDRFVLSRRRALGAGLAALAAPRLAWSDEVPRTAGPYVPTPQVIVDRMLQVARVGPDDFVVDLGSGDGRMVRTAAKVYGASGFGVDIDGELVEKSNAEAQREGVAGKVAFHQQDVFKADIRKASVVTLYVLPDMMLGLRPKMLNELKPGTRIVSHQFEMGDWKPEKTVEVNGRRIYFWTIPAKKGK
jgi:hypothetical protein